MLKNKSLVAKFGVNTAENEPQEEQSTLLLFSETNAAEYSVNKASHRLVCSPGAEPAMQHFRVQASATPSSF